MHTWPKPFTFLVIVIVLASTCFAADKKELSQALAAVEANLKTSEGKRYDEKLGQEFPAKYLSSIKQCNQSASSGGNADPFDMFLKLDAEGKVQEVLIYPESPLAVCSRTALQSGKFSSPPHADYWVNIHLRPQH